MSYEEKIQSFIDITKSNDETAKSFLEQSQQNLESAINLYFLYGNNIPLKTPAYFTNTSTVNHTSHPAHDNDDAMDLDFHRLAPTRPSSPVDNGSSGLIIPSSSTQAIVHDEYLRPEKVSDLPGPPSHTNQDTMNTSLQVRKPGVPAFFKCLAFDILANIMIILAHTPLFYQTLFCHVPVLNDYGFNSKWWSGVEIINHQKCEKSTETNVLNDHTLALIAETQRLIVFLWRTNRTYGSVDVLKSLMDRLTRKSCTGERAAGGVEQILQSFDKALSQVCSSSSINDKYMFRSVINGTNTDSVTLYSVDLNLSNTKCKSLYDAMDQRLWHQNDLDGELISDVWIEHVAKVLVIRIVQRNGVLGYGKFDIPMTWCVDRYMKENAGRIRATRQEMVSSQDELRKLDMDIINLETYNHPRQGITRDVNALFETLSQDSQINCTTNTTESLTERLDQAKLCINEMLLAMKGKRDEIQNRLNKCDEFLKNPTMNQPHNQSTPSLTYELRGIIPKLKDTYALVNEHFHRAEDNSGKGPNAEGEWWKWEYNSPTAINSQKVSQERVLEAVGNTNEVILVYSLVDKSIRLEIPEPLLKFIERDNGELQEEIEASLHE